MKYMVLLHGLHMHTWSLFYLNKKISSLENVTLIKFGYMSTLYSDKKVLDSLEKAISKIPSGSEVYFIGHSMGGLVAKNFLSIRKPKLKATLITLGTPHKGSRIGTKLIHSPLKFLMGSSGLAGVEARDVEWTGQYPMYCLVGCKNIGPARIISPLDKSPGDGTVYKDEAFDDRADKVIYIPNVTHTQMIVSPVVWNEIKEIIK